MYFSTIESHADAKAKHNQTLRENAKARLKKLSHMGTKKRAECAPNRKAKMVLDARIKDWEAMVKATNWKGDVSAYHKPGSLNLR